MQKNPLTDLKYCKELAARFIKGGGYKAYDVDGRLAEPNPTVISEEQIKAVNTGMLARTSYRAWERFLGRPIPELSDIPVNVDLILSPEEDVRSTIEKVRACYRVITAQKGITDMAASKVLYLKRPTLVAISDSYSRRRLHVPDRATAQRDWLAERGTRVLERARSFGRDNLETLQALQSYIGKQFDAEISLVRIIDIVLWSDEARGRGHKAFRGIDH